MDDVMLNAVRFYSYYATLLHLYRLELNEIDIWSWMVNRLRFGAQVIAVYLCGDGNNECTEHFGYGNT